MIRKPIAIILVQMIFFHVVWALFSKKRKHFLTVGFRDADNQPQGVVLELPKGKPKSIITIIEARSGVKCEYESEEARKHVHG
jgi:hypothetical protein